MNCHFYYPLELLNDEIGTRYNPNALQLRTHQSYIEDINAVMTAESTAHDQEWQDQDIAYFEILENA